MAIKQIDIRNKTKKRIDKDFLIKIVRITLDVLKAKEDYILGLLFVDKKTIKNLNNKYRGINSSTDVLSFSVFNKKRNFIDPPDNILYLGDIVICLDKIAGTTGKTSELELANLLIHGLLHIFGFTHNKKNDKKKMNKITEKILDELIKKKIL